MPSFGKGSLDKLNTCHPDLQKLMLEVVKKADCTITCGHRGKEEQEIAFKAGNSKVQFPNSKHNKIPSLAVDVAAYPVDWKDLRRFYLLAGYIKGTAERLGIKIRLGCDWNGNMEIKDDNFQDVPHIELVV